MRKIPEVVGKSLAEAKINVTTGTFKVMVLSASTSESTVGNWQFKNQVTGEASGTGYPAGGIVITVAGAIDNTANSYQLTLGDIVFPSPTTLTGAAIVVYQDTGNAATSPVLYYADFPLTITAAGRTVPFDGPISINFPVVP